VEAFELARLQFGLTTVYHFLFVPITIGLAPLLALMHTAYVRTGRDRYRRMSQFWGKIFLVNFAMGVVTGIVQEFQFGMNWSEYSRFVGDIFGAPLALEALIAFFLESTFLGLWIFGWDRLPPRLHLACIWLVAIGTTVSAYFILAANSFMQWPVGYELNPATGRAELTDFLTVLTNPHLLLQFPHTVVAAWVTAAFLILGISAWQLRRNHDVDVFGASAKLGLIVGFAAAVATAFIGHSQAQLMYEQQPMKMAAAEALWDTEQPAGFSLFAVGDIENGRNHINVVVPNGLSILATNTLDGEVRGINDIQAEYEERFGPGDYRPVVGVNYWSFRLMVGAGFAMIGLGALGLLLLRRGRLLDSRRFLWWCIPAIGLPMLGNAAGWIFTEMGRQPWVVFGVLRTEQGVSTAVGPFSVLTSLIVFTVIYGVLAAIEVGLLLRIVRHGTEEPGTDAEDDAERVVAPVIAY
jgi:cytochrome d ubiquinol oxidase subunit I